MLRSSAVCLRREALRHALGSLKRTQVDAAPGPWRSPWHRSLRLHRAFRPRPSDRRVRSLAASDIASFRSFAASVLRLATLAARPCKGLAKAAVSAALRRASDRVRFVSCVLGGKDEQDQGHQERPERRHMARDTAFHVVARQLARLEEQRRDGSHQSPVQVEEALDGFPAQPGDRALVSVNVLATDVAVGAVQVCATVGAGLTRRRHGPRLWLCEMRQGICRGRFEFAGHPIPLTDFRSQPNPVWG